MAGLVSILATVALGASPTASSAPAGVTRAPAVAPRTATTPRASSTTSSAKLLGQRIMVGLQSPTADASLLRRIRQGRIGSVILFARNITSRGQLLGLTRALQSAARRGGNPPLLIAIDQEGGQVKRLSAGPPQLTPPQMTATGSPTVAAREGRATGRYLRALGINMNLAPVVDVPTYGGAFIWRQGRAFSFDAQKVARFAGAFATGLQSQRVAATAKHFPGVGSAAVDTDFKLDQLRPTSAQLSAALVPYRKLISQGLDAVMLSTAGFPAYDASGAPAALSRPIAHGLLRGRLGFRGVTITDALGTPTGHDQVTAGVLAARAGADILLYTDMASGELPALQRAFAAGRISRADATAAYRRIVALKAHVAGR